MKSQISGPFYVDMRAEHINPANLLWAREAAGFSIEEAAEKLDLSSVQKLQRFEGGEEFPTRNQLEKFASVYRRPLLVFYMAKRPEMADRGEDFRSLAEHRSVREEAMVDALVRDIRARQQMIRSILEDEDDVQRLPFVNSMTMALGVKKTAQSICDVLKFDCHARRKSGDVDALFKELRHRAEVAGVFVLLVGDLGSYHSAISETVFRGFAISDEIAPFVVVNSQDAKSARSFTLLHELAHLWLGQSGLSGSPQEIEYSTEKGRLEQFCNDVAGEILLPSDAFQQKPANMTDNDRNRIEGAVTEVAAQWSVSEPMVAYRFFRLGWMSPAIYRELTKLYAARWRAARQQQREGTTDSDGGPNAFMIKKFRLGDGLLSVVNRTVRDNALSYSKAAKVLGVRIGSVGPLLDFFSNPISKSRRTMRG